METANNKEMEQQKDQQGSIVIPANTPKLRIENKWKWTAIALLVILVVTQVAGINLHAISQVQGMMAHRRERLLMHAVLPEQGVELPVRWGDMGVQMLDTGVIDRTAFEQLYASRGGMSDDEAALLHESDNETITITKDNADFLLNLFWAFGLSNKNAVLDHGSMMTYSDASTPAEARANAARLASTGGWSLSAGAPMDHYSMHQFLVLTPEQQEMVERVAQGIFRPCCGNSVYFPDCNHGMAMLGLLELLAYQGASEEELYDYALAVNSYWFPDTYVTIAKFFQKRDADWDTVLPQTVLGDLYSSGAGYQRVLANVTPPENIQQGGGCGV